MTERVFILTKYRNNNKINTFIQGDELFSSSEVFQMIEDDGIAWDDLRLLDYSEKSEYESDLREFNDVKDDLENYKVILLKPVSYLKDKYKRMKYVMKNKLLSDDISIRLDKTKKETPKQKRRRVEGNRPNMGNAKIVIDKSKEESRPMYFVNLIKIREVAMYPPGYKGKQISGIKALKIYARIAYKTNTKHKNEFLPSSGDVVNTIADNTATHTDWDTFGIVKYKSFASLLAFSTEPTFVKSFVHKDAGIDHTYVYAAFTND
ncbi:MAG: hypothetical protein ACTSPS_13260 [Promethearchaeota archaeon]